MANDIQQWWNELPIVTKYLFALSFGLTLAANFGLVNPFYIILDFSKVFKGFEVRNLEYYSFKSFSDLEISHLLLLSRKAWISIPDSHVIPIS
jgi:hypothetical protein